MREGDDAISSRTYTYRHSLPPNQVDFSTPVAPLPSTPSSTVPPPPPHSEAPPPSDAPPPSQAPPPSEAPPSLPSVQPPPPRDDAPLSRFTDYSWWMSNDGDDEEAYMAEDHYIYHTS